MTIVVLLLLAIAVTSLVFGGMSVAYRDVDYLYLGAGFLMAEASWLWLLWTALAFINHQ